LSVQNRARQQADPLTDARFCIDVPLVEFVMQTEIGKLAGIYIGANKGAGKASVGAAEMIADHGLRGDSHAGRDVRRQISLFALERLRELQAEGFDVSAGQLSANLFTEHLQLDSLNPRTRLRIGEVEIEIVERRTPCRSITRIDPRLPKRLYGQCGQLARIIKGGVVRANDTIEIVADERQLGFQW
jgi:MOSC domain-containing protein YiiM